MKALVQGIWDEEGNAMESAPHPKQQLKVLLSEPCEKYDLLRMESQKD